MFSTEDDYCNNGKKSFGCEKNAQIDNLYESIISVNNYLFNKDFLKHKENQYKFGCSFFFDYLFLYYISNAFIEKKASLIGEIVGLIDAALEADLSNALGHLYLISTIVEKECDITSITLLMIKLYDIKKDFIKVIGLRAMKNAKCLEDNMNNFLEIKPMNEKLQIIGKILSILLKINVDI